ncbi:MAG: efflux transporter periplasmic adaptor subunit [Gammaproteobacteria bacterium]|nr:MAG: efflux transporter periplasmic adaptor subunit [Gammaproteobacteria bacterium]
MNKSFLLTAVLLVVAFCGGYWFSDYSSEPGQAAESAVRQPLFYRHPMNPKISSPVPAKDSMGMDYIPVFDEADSSADSDTESVAGTVVIDPVVVQNIGVRTAAATVQSLSRTIRAVGRVAHDERRMTRLHPKIEGWIEEIRVDKTGQQVMADEILLSVYSPKLVSTQQEYLLALSNLNVLKDSPFADIKNGAQQLVTSSRRRLTLLDVPEHQIRELEQSHVIKKNLHIHSPATGTVTHIGARQGQYVNPATELYTIVDLSRVWIYADIYEYELPWVKVGDLVTMTLASSPGKTFTGEIAYIYPYAEANTRTTKVRMVFDNSDKQLRPDMLADIVISSDAIDDAVVIPAEAVVRSGSVNQVFVVRGPGKFEPRVVSLGIESGGQVAIVSGVEAGEQVVTSAQFLLDSESQLREATAKMREQLEQTPEPPVDHANHQSMPAHTGHAHD